MNFFDAQDRARRSTRWLVIVYVIATALIVAGVTLVVAVAFHMVGETGRPADPSILVATAILATLLIIGATVYKTARLSSGGGRVAIDMGGTLVPADVHDPLRRRLRNVIEEMAIASGVPVPEIYVLEQEMSINAFAAGFTPGDAAIAVTRGTLEILDRDELQGVIAHEFSHILNGDMRLNIRMMGVLFGIMVLGIIGRLILRSGYYSGLASSRRNRNAPVIMIVGLGLAVLGWIGLFCARLVKAAVSRQREFLADASAVQFTRQSEGIASALKKIGGYTAHSYIRSTDPEEVSHMLFAGGISRLTSLFATHPPLIERIQALDPGFSEDDYPVVAEQMRSGATRHASGEGQARGLVEEQAAAGTRAEQRTLPASIPDAVARPDPQQLAFAGQLRRSIPSEIYAAAHSPEQAWVLALALALDLNTLHSERQLRFVDEQLGVERGQQVRRYFGQIRKIGAVYRLPILEIAFPALKRRPVPQLEYLLELVRRLIELDGEVDLYEYCFFRVLTNSLEQAEDPSGRRKRRRSTKKAVRQAAIDLLRTVARHGHSSAEARASAFRAGAAEFGQWASDAEYGDETLQTVTVLDRSLTVLARTNSAGRKSLLQAVGKTVSHDGKMSVPEAELLRVICASLDCPLPPILG
ncbi:MAG: M48 family metallopeptidase [Proteobacteria bacterium]|nr:M48 family metallopeptidase [Pseudomonadota bacterium]